ncbi:hypothetical protein ACFLYH_02485 [Candidatus Dependentiae bacterium]
MVKIKLFIFLFLVVTYGSIECSCAKILCAKNLRMNLKKDIMYILASLGMSITTDYGVKKLVKNHKSIKKIVNNHVFVGMPQFGIYYLVTKILKKIFIKHKLTKELLAFLTSYIVMLLLYRYEVYKEYIPTIDFIHDDNPAFLLFFYYSLLKSLA